MDQAQALKALSAMAHDTRLEIVRLLVPCRGDGMPAGEIADQLGVSASALSFHLTALEQAGLVTSQRQSRKVIYKANHTCLGDVIGYLLNDCCGAHPEIRSCSHLTESEISD